MATCPKLPVSPSIAWNFCSAVSCSPSMLPNPRTPVTPELARETVEGNFMADFFSSRIRESSTGQTYRVQSSFVLLLLNKRAVYFHHWCQMRYADSGGLRQFLQRGLWRHYYVVLASFLHYLYPCVNILVHQNTLLLFQNSTFCLVMQIGCPGQII